MWVFYRDRESGQAEALPCKEVEVIQEDNRLLLYDEEGDWVVLGLGKADIFVIRRQEDLQNDTGQAEG